MMNYGNDQYITATDLSFVGILHDIKKSKTPLQPVFECFTNALEAIKIKQQLNPEYKGEIIIAIHFVQTLLDTIEFSHLSITDDGIGFDEQQFVRFNKFKDLSKGFKNLGSGRIQYVHFFDQTFIKSTFQQGDNFFDREFVISKKEVFLARNAIVLHRYCRASEKNQTLTKVEFSSLLTKSESYDELNHTSIKEKLLERYIHYFCCNRTNLPSIKIELYIDSSLVNEAIISENDIPNIDQQHTTHIPYYRKTKKGIEQTDKQEDFTITAFKIPKHLLKENKLNLVSKGEVIQDSDIRLEHIGAHDSVEGNKYLFLVSSNYIDDRDTNLRGELNIHSRNTQDLFSNSEEIFIEDIQQKINASIDEMYPEVKNIRQKHQENFENLKEMFLLDDAIAENIIVSVNDKESDILKKFYEAEAKKEAEIDATIKQSMDNLNQLDTTSPNYEKDLEKEIKKLVQSIPLQNTKALTHYVARRKLVLDLFDKILERKLQIQETSGNRDEALIHNLLFQQSSTNPERSDLWIINEDFIYFKGSSEKQLSQLEINGKKLFKDEFSIEEERYLTDLCRQQRRKTFGRFHQAA